MPELLRFQKEDVETLLQRKHNLLAHTMGLGKTVIAIEMMNQINFGICTTLIICPATIKINWKRKLNEWWHNPYNFDPVQIIGKKTDVIEPWATVVIINYDLISHSYMFKQLTDRTWDLLICDEAHRLKNMAAQRTKAVLCKNGIAHYARHTLMMTGTPVLNRPIELYPMLRVFAPQAISPYDNYIRYARRFCDAFQDGFSFNVSGASHTEELNARLREHYMVRRTWKDVENQLPAKRYEMVMIDQSEEVKPSLRILDNAERTDFKHQKSGASAGELATLRRETAENKIRTCIDQIKDYCDSVDKIVIFAYHHSVIELLEKELASYGTLTVTGNIPNAKRQTAIDEFTIQPDKRVFIAQLQAAGEGIDGLQVNCHHALFVEWSWVPGEIEQAVARLYRMGQSKSVLARFLVWADSIEEHMLRVALDKVKVIKEILK